MAPDRATFPPELGDDVLVCARRAAYGHLVCVSAKLHGAMELRHGGRGERGESRKPEMREREPPRRGERLGGMGVGMRGEVCRVRTAAAVVHVVWPVILCNMRVSSALRCALVRVSDSGVTGMRQVLTTNLKPAHS